MPGFAVYLLMSIFSIIAAGAITRTFWLFTREGGALDIVFRWQYLLDWLYKGGTARQLLGKALGDCNMCTSFWFGLLLVPLHIVIVSAFTPWPISGILANVVYVIAWWNVSGMVNFFFIKNID